MKNERTKLVILAIVVGCLFTSLLATAKKPEKHETYYITIIDFSLEPEGINIKPGDMVIWHNTDSVIHTLWFTHLNGRTNHLSSPIAPNGIWTHIFDDEMDLQYFSFDKLWINGFIAVNSAKQYMTYLMDSEENHFGKASFETSKANGYYDVEVQIEECLLLAKSEVEVYVDNILVGEMRINGKGNGYEIFPVDHISSLSTLTVKHEGIEVLYTTEWTPWIK